MEQHQSCSPFHSREEKAPRTLNSIIASYKLNYFVCLNTVTLLFCSELLLPSVCITLIFSTPTLCTLRCQNPASIIPVITLLFLPGEQANHQRSLDLLGALLGSPCRAYTKQDVAEVWVGALSPPIFCFSLCFCCCVSLASIMTAAATEQSFRRSPPSPAPLELALLFLLE